MKTTGLILTALGLAHALTPLPEGNTGIAAQYPGDSGIASNSAVVFADDFESYSSPAGLSSRWNGGVYHNVTFATTGTNVFAGKQSLQFRNPKQSAELSNTVDRLLSQEQDQLFLRFYSKFDTSFDVTGSSHNGCMISASYFVNGNATPGVKADGYNKFLANFECWRGQTSEPNPGYMNVYIYHPEQRDIWGDHFFPTGIVLPWTYLPGNFGPDFVARPDTNPDLGRWYCYEFMVKANTPGQRDGRIACWLDGKLMADFPNLRLRDIDTLKIDRFGLSLHIGSNTVRETFKYYDNVVAATSYIGPVSGAVSSQKLPAPPGGTSFHFSNPCGPGDNIGFSLRDASTARLDIFDLLGRPVKTVANGSYSAGAHALRWDGRTNRGEKVSPGIYLAIFQAGTFRQAKEMAVVR